MHALYKNAIPTASPVKANTTITGAPAGVDAAWSVRLAGAARRLLTAGAACGFNKIIRGELSGGETLVDVKCKHDKDYSCPVEGDCSRSGCMLIAEGDGVAVDRYFL